jgi:protein O-mannosyl-transferase
MDDPAVTDSSPPAGDTMVVADEPAAGDVPVRPRRRWPWAPLLVVVLVLVAYAPLWNADFSWDDGALVAENRLTGSLSNLLEFFRVDLWRTTRLPAPPSGYYRPLFLVSLAIDQAVAGLSPRIHHLDSLLWHIGTATVLYTLLRRIVDYRLALAGMLFFALHPVQSEAVALVAARNDSMAAFFLLLSLLLLEDRSARAPKLVAGGLAGFFALLSKESAVLLPAFLLVLDLARRRWPGALTGADDASGVTPNVSRSWPRYAVLGVALAAYAVLRLWAGVGEAAIPKGDNWSLVARYTPQLAGVYSGLIVWPWPLSPARHIHYLPPFSVTLPRLLALAALLFAALRWGRNRPAVLLGLAWAVLAFAPTVLATVDKGLLGERYLYMPMAGLALAVAGALPARKDLFKVEIPFAIATVVALWFRLPAWQDSLALWQAAQDDDPTPFTAAGLGWYLNHVGQDEQALPYIVSALEGDPPFLDTCPLVVMIPMLQHKPADAVRLGSWALKDRGCPPTAEMLGPYALALASTGHWDQAIAVASHPAAANAPAAPVVLAAGMARQGNQDMLRKLEAAWKGPGTLRSQVVRLLRTAGDDQTAAQVEGTQAP